MKLKFQAFKDVAHKMNLFLTVFQTDAPMIPFLSDTLESLMRRIMGYFVRGTVLDEAATPYQLMKIDVSFDSKSLLLVKDVKLPTATKAMLKQITPTPGQKETFLKDYRRFILAISQKMQERCPLSSHLVRCASSLNPVNMANQGRACIVKFGALVDRLYEHKWLNDREGDDAKAQYEEFITDVVRPNNDIFADYDFTDTRLDDFFSVHLAGSKKYICMWKVTKFIFVLPHGQASIERGFNVNKEFLIENLQELSLKSMRLVYDQVKSMDQKIHEVSIPRELVISCKEAYKKYKVDQDEKGKIAAETEVSKKRKLKQEEIVDVKRTKLQVEKVIDILTGDIEKVSIEASTKETFEEMKVCLEKANSFRNTLKQKRNVLNDLGKAMEKLEEELNI